MRSTSAPGSAALVRNPARRPGGSAGKIEGEQCPVALAAQRNGHALQPSGDPLGGDGRLPGRSGALGPTDAASTTRTAMAAAGDGRATARRAHGRGRSGRCAAERRWSDTGLSLLGQKRGNHGRRRRRGQEPPPLAPSAKDAEIGAVSSPDRGRVLLKREPAPKLQSNHRRSGSAVRWLL